VVSLDKDKLDSFAQAIVNCRCEDLRFCKCVKEQPLSDIMKDNIMRYVPPDIPKKVENRIKKLEAKIERGKQDINKIIETYDPIVKLGRKYDMTPQMLHMYIDYVFGALERVHGKNIKEILDQNLEAIRNAQGDKKARALIF
jgi:hypothetical protein